MDVDRPPDPPEISLADWRRRVAELYANVRRLAATDPPTAHRAWCDAREGLYRGHPQSPVPVGGRGAFHARHFPYDPALRFEVAVAPIGPADDAGSSGAADAGPFLATAPGAGGTADALPNSGGEHLHFRELARLTLPFPDRPRSLTLYWMGGYAGGLFLPFRDETNGLETYGAGRYVLDTAKGADLGPGREPGTIVVDLNFAYQPSCAFDARWACPLAPPENRLDLAVRAGERIA